MKNYFLVILIVLVIIMASGCIYSGNYGYTVIDKSVKLNGGFNQIMVSVSVPIHLIITQSDKESLTVEKGRSETSKVNVE